MQRLACLIAAFSRANIRSSTREGPQSPQPDRSGFVQARAQRPKAGDFCIDWTAGRDAGSSWLCYPASMAPELGAARRTALPVRARTACGVVAGPAFVTAFTVIGARRAGYDWRRHAVSSLADGPEGWAQRANFVLVGSLYCLAAQGLARSPRRSVGPSVVPRLIFGVGAGLIGSGLFVTDPVAGFPPASADAPDGEPPKVASTRAGKLHNLCAIPIFAGIPAAGLLCAGSAARRREYRWAAYSAGSAIGMAGAFVLFSAAFGGRARLVGRGGVFQRISVATGSGWLTALSLRALRASRHA